MIVGFKFLQRYEHYQIYQSNSHSDLFLEHSISYRKQKSHSRCRLLCLKIILKVLIYGFSKWKALTIITYINRYRAQSSNSQIFLVILNNYPYFQLIEELEIIYDDEPFYFQRMLF